MASLKGVCAEGLDCLKIDSNPNFLKLTCGLSQTNRAATKTAILPFCRTAGFEPSPQSRRINE